MPAIPDTVLIFDAVGTLIRPRESISLVYQGIGSDHGIKLEQDSVRERFQSGRTQFFGNGLEQDSSESLEKDRWSKLVEFVFRELDDTSLLFGQLWEYYAQPANWILFPDVGECLTSLLDDSHPIAIASNFDDRLHEICRQLPPLHRIDHIFCSSQIGYCKPDPRFFDAVLSRLTAANPRHTRSRLIMIGDDRVKDVRAARDAGWRARLLDRANGDFPGLISGLQVPG